MNDNFINNTLPATSTLLCYIINEIKKTDFMFSVAYMENGVIKDTMFDTFLFLPSGAIVSQTNNKASWDSYIRDRQYASEANLNALEQAVGEVKAALRRDFKVNVILSLWSPDKKIINFGEVNGKNLNLSISEDRKTAMKYFVDEQIKHFKAKNLKILTWMVFTGFRNLFIPKTVKQMK